MRDNGIIVVGLVIVLLAVTLAGLEFTARGPGMMLGGAMMNGTWMNGMMGDWSVIGALVIGAGELAMLWSVRRPGPTLLATSVRDSPLDVLKTRYAKGEITREQVEEMQRTINT